jgi:multisubunit Na+/H+ antiporter MnhG subunit
VSPDLTKLIGGGGVGLVMLAALYYFLRHLQSRDAMDEVRSQAFLLVTKSAVEAIGRIDARAGVVLDAVDGIDDQLGRIEARLAEVHRAVVGEGK